MASNSAPKELADVSAKWPDVVTLMESSHKCFPFSQGYDDQRAAQSGKAPSSLKQRSRVHKRVSLVLPDMANGQQALIQHVSRLRLSDVDRLLTAGVDPNCFDDSQRTPLHVATAKMSLPIVELLLVHGAKPNCLDCIGNTPLHLACTMGNLQLTKLLLDHGAIVDSPNPLLRSPMDLACSRLKMLQQHFLKDSHPLLSDAVSARTSLLEEMSSVVELVRAVGRGRSDSVLLSELTQLDEKLQRLSTNTTLPCTETQPSSAVLSNECDSSGHPLPLDDVTEMERLLSGLRDLTVARRDRDVAVDRLTLKAGHRSDDA